MKRSTKQRLIKGCIATVVALSSTLSPLAANAATANGPSAVTRIGGANQYETAALISQKGWTGTCASVVLSTGLKNNLVDALAAGPLAASLKAPILLTDNGQQLNSYAKSELLRLKPQNVYITSGSAVIKPSVIEEIKGMGITPVQLGGNDQYETSVNIAKEIAQQGVPISRVMVTAGWLSPSDALSIASIAAAQGIPILTTTQSQLPDSVKTYLDSIKTNVTESDVIGGTAVVSDTVANQLPGKVNRYFGQTKYDTNLQILKDMAGDYRNNKVYVANGETLVDALAGVSLAAADHAPILLVNSSLDSGTKNFVKSMISTQDMVVLGGEAVVPSAELNSLNSTVAYSTDNETLGSKDPAKPQELTDNIQITGSNVTLSNAKADYSIYVKGDNITLSNVNVQGTVFLDPGDNGTAALDGVTAANIVILSGAQNSILLKNTSTERLTVDSSKNVHVEAAGTTTINNIVVRSSAIIEADGANLGTLAIQSPPDQSPVVELRGTFTQPVTVSGEVNLKAASDAVIPSVVISPENPKQTVTLDGSFKNVEMTTQGNVTLAANSAVETMKSLAKAEIIVPSTATIGNLDIGSTGSLVGGGGKVNGQITPVTPTPGEITTTPTSGGGAAPTTTSTTPTQPTPPTDSNKLTVTSVYALASDNVTRQVTSDNTFDFTGTSDSVVFTGLKITANQSSPKLVIESIRLSSGVELLNSSISAAIDSSGVVTTGDLLGGLGKGENGLSLKSLRSFLGTGNVVFKGKITKDGYQDSDELTFTIKLGNHKS
ncbi:N-acetylmuramoyl-L-alanine amidase LytC precursor [Desulfosporosinus acididurans]|uniref:N-acetylmuramoyl-L-alanine amidase LytC n=1 Tax=Desulfosporosinus acididurans TaxID=476652 RepID=A0A0J1IN71_9FIRM|nr:cell wall-binding repeat-containing protein [Desulfosporosinus acididurans]KLU66136.1 N-acetylmuramoyl-L-alanine amidase LytC precursor [Desulfosporosinus acididurans]